ncbi:5-hydroxytryptamine receptor 4 [Sitophilus oryzae]|uniref:5-hydroxytryptamine receptor 4 n=1 Tax=Sitophilus oryzae TaxID=7048 RepID=A0A6J2YEF8_SITOR|nr:5-hydroxytryptamine receptor 4 [Sitophilus oryzae]XP_030761549.1 5-hydroxytryptamine receptor 4 [Sitophilus oryzae]
MEANIMLTINYTTTTPVNSTYDYQTSELNSLYAICELVVAVLAVAGNALVIHVFRKERRLRRRTNYYIVSLAAADFLVGLLGIPFALMSSVGLPNNLHACLFTVSLLVVLCTISIFCLVAVSVDRYWAILHPMGYSRNVRTKTALVIISICWFAGSFIGFLPLMGWHQDRPNSVDCFFLTVMDYNYLVFLYFGTIITPALILIGFYAHIYRVVLKQLRQIVVMNPENGTKKSKNLPSGGMVRMLGVQQRNEVRATQNLAIIVLFFMICWIPLYTINCIIAFYKDFQVNSSFMLSCIILSHLNSAGNPLLYAYHLRDFRAALKNFFCNLFHLEQQICDQFPPKYPSNYSRTPYRNSSINTDVQRRYRSQSKVETMLKNSTVIAAVPTGNIHRNIWNIAEDSGRDSGSSQDSLKDLNVYHPEKLFLKTKPLKKDQPKVMNQTYVDSSSIEDSDDVFMDDCLSYSKDINETCLTNAIRSCPVENTTMDTSLSSLHKSKPVFVVEQALKTKEDSLKEQKKDSLDVVKSPKSAGRMSPYKLVRGIFKGRRKLKRSLSDGGERNAALKDNNGTIVVDYYSVPI